MASLDATHLALSNSVTRPGAVGELRDYLRRGLGKSFGEQLSDADLDDLTQDALTKVVARLDSFRGRSQLKTWAMSIAVNEALQALRKRRYEHVELSEAIAMGHELISAPSAPGLLERAEDEALLRRAIQEVLSPAQRESLLAELGGLPLAEIARRQGKTRGALYKSLHDARRKLRAHFLERGIRPEDLGGSHV
ncbi:MAG: RNA polymerase sigma factor [Proteobacteria bacterium]|nr:RNA polymerase sigma factor [Pseudomonadota bacterium]